jgi:site-specific DNA-methyltransferase (adenine-specific)
MIVSQSPRIDLIHGDCMDYMATLPDNAFELAIVDPPYGVDFAKRGSSMKWGAGKLPEKDWDASIPDDKYFEELKRVSKNQIIWGGNYFPHLFPSRCFVVWDKGAGFRNRCFAEAELAWTSFDKNAKVFSYDPLANGDYKGRIHITQKPVALYRWLLHNYAKAGDRILDTHLGSGSSAIACHGMGFDMVGIELDEDYYTASVKRFKQQTAQLAIL